MDPSQVSLHYWSPNRLVDVFDRITSTGKVTVNDRSIFLAALFDPSTSNEEFSLIDRIYYFVCRGRLQMTDNVFPCLDCQSQPPKPSLSKEVIPEFAWESIEKNAGQALSDTVAVVMANVAVLQDEGLNEILQG